MSYLYTLGSLFSSVAAVHPERPALLPPAENPMTFGQLESLSNRLTHYLLGQGVKRGQVVAIFHDKSPICFALMLACLKLGAIYVNLDPESPRARLEKVLRYAAPAFVVTGENCPVEHDLAVVNLQRLIQDDSFDGLLEKLPTETLQVVSSDPAYLMFTSGSTGDPKGAVIPHRAVMNFIAWGREQFQISGGDILTNLNPMYFDNSVFDFYASLFNGAGLVPLPESLVKNPRHAVKAIAAAGCTLWFCVPSLLVYMQRMRALKKGELTSLRIVAFGGEGFPKESLRKLRALFPEEVKLVNVYGPTECTCICSAYGVRDEDYERPELLPLGHIAPNFDYSILDEQGQPVEPGTVGELYLKGPNVGLGYYRNPEHTVGSFIQDPQQPGYHATIYKTGDLVSLNPDTGYLHFSGRKDYQIKKMGYRIELEEIEVALGSLAGASETGCVYLAEQRPAGQIVAFVAGENLMPEELLEQLRDLLPGYMIPDRLLVVAELPKNSNGKIDRHALKQWACEKESG